MDKLPIRILLVEDSPSDARLLQNMVSRSGGVGWEIIRVERLSEAIATCTARAVDVVLLDLSLPDSDGLETVVEFHAAVPELPIVVLTGVDDEEIGLQAVACGAQDYLVKAQLVPEVLARVLRYAIERGQILRQLQESERRFRGIFDQTFQAIWLLTPQGNVLEVNQTGFELSGVQPEDCLGLPLWQLNYWQDLQTAQEWLNTAIAKAREGEFVRDELPMLGTETLVWMDFSLKPLKDERGQAVMLIAEARDISDRKLAEAEILKTLERERELNQLKSSFVSMVSHEFRNPLTTIQSSSEILQRYERKLNRDKKSQHFDRIQSSLNSMIHLLDEILLLGKSEAGKLQYKPVSLNLEQFCRNLTETLQQSADGQHEIIFTCQGEVTQVEMDEALLGHIFSNLLSNAVKYSSEGGTVWFNLVCTNGVARFQVRDEGIGIPLNDQKHLFDTFHRASNVGQIKGTGLGLSIVKKCVKLHQGQIRVESEVGVGTRFIVTLPTNLSA